MDVMIRYFDGPGPSTAQGVVDYVGTHLQAPTEAGGFAQIKGYLTQEGRVVPLVDSITWRLVGWDGKGLPPERLLKNLCQGRDLSGHRLTQARSLFRQPKEMVISLPCELSEALSQDPVAGHEILCVAIETAIKTLEEAAVRKRNGKGRKASPDWLSGKLLSLDFPHAKNRAGEADLHSHIYIFPPALGEDGVWRTFDNGRHMASLSKPGGPREQVRSAIIAEAKRWGYIVEIAPGNAQGDGPQGAKVICPDGRVLERGSVPRTRRAEVLAAQEMARECGAPPLTPKQLELVRRETGRFPADLLGIKRLDLLQKKLHNLGYLSPEGQILPPNGILIASQKMECGMAVAQVSLSELAHMPGARFAMEIIKERRRHLVAQIPGVEPDTHHARIRWTSTYDQALELVAAHPEGLGTGGLDKPTRNTLSKLKRAGILMGQKDQGRIRYTLAPAGEARLTQGRVEQAELESLVVGVAQQAMGGATSPNQVRGRLEMLGIQTCPPLGRFEVGAVGRVVQAEDLIARSGIQPSTQPVPDLPWWERWWMRGQELPDLLRRTILRPVEILHRWSLELGHLAAIEAFTGARARRAAALKANQEAEAQAKRQQAVPLPASPSRRVPTRFTSISPSAGVSHERSTKLPTDLGQKGRRGHS